MKLVRVAFMTFRSELKGWEAFKVQSDGVVLSTLPIGTVPAAVSGRQILVAAETRLDSELVLNADGCVVIPDEPRRRIESLIETTADMIAVSAQCEHSVSSATPPVALVAETEKDCEFLERSRGLDARPVVRQSTYARIEMSEEIMAGLSDRRDGLGLLAEVYCHDRAIGRYRELMRLFELGFALPVTSLSKKVSQFLSSGPFGYNHDEVRSWCALRHGSIHGDRSRTRRLVLEADVRPVIHRIEQAALDIVFNKTEWHSPSRERRRLWTPVAGTTAGSDLFITQGAELEIRGTIHDPFHAYPMHLQGILVRPPEHWWHHACPGKTPMESCQSAPTPSIRK